MFKGGEGCSFLCYNQAVKSMCKLYMLLLNVESGNDGFCLMPVRDDIIFVRCNRCNLKEGIR